jgi:hypothetical protein
MEDAMKGSEFTIARYYALQAVKQQWKDRGSACPISVSYTVKRETTSTTILNSSSWLLKVTAVLLQVVGCDPREN